jgi:hypothetical protein
MVLVLSLMLWMTSTRASHLAAVDLTITHISGNDYQITLVIYRDCSGIPAPTTVGFNIFCVWGPYNSFTAPGVLQPSISGQVITVTCPSMLTQCNGGVLYGVEAYVYQAVVMLPPAFLWKVRYFGCCRNPSNTIYQPTGTDFLIEAELNNLDAPFASTPVFTNFPVNILCTQQANEQNPGAVDLDGDSLSYELVAPIASYDIWSGYTYVSHISPHTPTQPLPSNPPVSLNPVTGALSITPTMNIVAPVKIEIKKWRKINGIPTIIGRIGREIQLYATPCNTMMPVMAGMDFSVANGYDPNDTIFLTEVCAGDTVQFAIWGHDADTLNANNPGNPEQFSFFWNQAIPGAGFAAVNQSTDSAYAIFTWVPGSLDARPQPHCFLTTIRDKSCPYNLSSSQFYCIKVNPTTQVDIGPDKVICHGESVTFQAIADSGAVIYLWMVNGIPTGAPLTNTHFTFNSSTWPIGTYAVSVDVINTNPSIYCNGKDVALVQVQPPPFPYLGNDTAVGLSNSITLDAGNYTSYLWSIGATSQTIVVDTTVFGSGIHPFWVEVMDSMGCAGRDTILIHFTQNPGMIDDPHRMQIMIFPNPGSGEFLIQFSGFQPKTADIQLAGLDGTLVYQEKQIKPGPSGIVKVSANGIAVGVYLLSIYTEHGAFQEKLVIRR